MTLEEQIALWAPSGSPQGYVVIGEGYDPTLTKGPYLPRVPRTWGRGGKAPLLADNCNDDMSPHAARFGGTRSGKSSAIVSDACTFNGAMMFLDPAIELAPILARMRMRTKGHRVVALATDAKDLARLRSIPGLRVGGMNVLKYIPREPEEAEIQAKNVVEQICGYTPEYSSTHQYFTGQGKDLVLCLLADMLADQTLPDEARNLTGLRLLISDPALPDRLKRIYVDSPSTVASSFAGELYPISQKADETWMSIFTTANAQTRWLTFPRYARLVCGDEFDTDDITRGDTDIFWCVPLDTWISEPALTRCFLGAMIAAVKRADGENDWIVFELDEIAHIKRMKEIENLPYTIAKNHMKTIWHFQDIRQPEIQFGHDGLNKLINQCGWTSYLALTDPGSCEHVQKRLGSYGAIRWSQNENTSGRFGQWWRSWSKGTSYSETEVPLKRASALANMRRDAQIVIDGTGNKAVNGVSHYHRRPRFANMVDRNRFIREGYNGHYRRDQTNAQYSLAGADGETVEPGSAAANGSAGAALADPTGTAAS